MTMTDQGATNQPRHAKQCAVCGGSLAPRFPTVVDPQTRETFAIVGCASCGLGHTDPQPADLAPYYGPKYHGGRHTFTERWCLARRLRFVKQAAGRRGGKLLDVGCGDGSFLEAARDAGWTGFGVEMNPEPPRAKGFMVERDLEALVTEAPFDVITFWHSLEHFREPAAALETAAKLLAPNGVLLVAVPDAGGLQAKAWGAKWFHLDVPRHLFHFTHDALMRLFTRAGLSVKREWNQEIEIDVFGWIQSPLNMIHDEPNRLFNTLTGRRNSATVVQRATDLATAALIGPLAATATFASTATRRGGTLVVAGVPSAAS